MTSHLSFFRKCLCTVALFALAALPAVAQSAASGSITGTITDASGAAIAGAIVVITDTDTGAVHTLTTNGSGSFNVPFLQSGHYEVLSKASNFTPSIHKNLVLTVGQTLTIDSSLAAASAGTEITVSTDGPLLDTQKTDVSQTITQEYINNLPLATRRWDAFVLLTPNVAPDGNSGFVSFRGINGLYNTNMVDGVNNQQALFSEARGRATLSPYVYAPDSIKEFQSSISGYTAEFGGAAGGVVNAITKSGTNALHGDLFYNLRYPTLNAVDPYSKFQVKFAGANPALATPLIHQQHQFGGSIASPIIKDKLFYFFTYDGFRRAGPVLYASGVNANNSGSTLGYLAYLGDGTTANTTNCPAPLTLDECAAGVQFLLSQQGAFGRNLKQDIFFPKLDWQPTSKDHLSTNFLWDDYKQPNVYVAGSTFTASGISTNAGYFVHERFLVGTWDHILSNNSANSFKFQWSRDLETSNSGGPGPNVSITSFAAYGEATGVPRIAEPDEHRIEFVDTFSKTQGKHTWKVGADVNIIHEIMIQLFQGDGTYTYSNNPTSGITAFGQWIQDVYNVNGGQHYSGFNQGIDAINKTDPKQFGKDDFWIKEPAFFAEDQWKMMPSLTVTAGVRWDMQLVPQPPVPYTTSSNGTHSTLGTAVTTTIPINYKMIQPRIGFAYNPWPKTIVRGGYGIFYGLAPGSEYYNMRVENGSFQGTYGTSSIDPTLSASNAGTPSAYTAGLPSATNTFFAPPAGTAQPFTCTGGAFTAVTGHAGGGGCVAQPVTSHATGLPVVAVPVSYHGMDSKFTPPHSHSMDLSVEQQLTPTTSLTLSYVGTRGMRLPFAPDANIAPWTGATKTYDVVNAAGVTQRTVTVPFYPSTVARPQPTDGNVSVIRSVLNTWYNAMSVSIKQQTKWGLQGIVNYTWAHTQDSGQVSAAVGGTFFGTDVILDPYNIQGHYANPNINMTREAGNSDIDMRERFVASLVYTSKFGFENRFARTAASGWVLSGTATEQTGFPITAMMNSGNPGTGTYTPVGGGTATAAGQDGAATGGGDNTSNAPSSAVGRVPFLKRNGFPGPGVHNLDMRFGREFPISHGVKMEFFVEAFNIVNHRNGLAVANVAYAFGAPSLTSATCPSGTHTNTCIAPSAAAATTPFGTINSTSSNLYGPRQLQFSAKMFF